MRHTGSAFGLVVAAGLISASLWPAHAETTPTDDLRAADGSAIHAPIVAVEADPLTLAVLQDLTDRKAKTTDPQTTRWLDALGSFYADASEGLLWVTADGWTPRAQAAIAELRRAGDWGLDSSAFEIPSLPAGAAASPLLQAHAETGLSFAILTYAWHAAGGRFEPSDLSLWFDQSAQSFDALSLLKDLSFRDDAAGVLQGLHPQHAQFKALHKAYLAMRYPAGAEKSQEPEKPKQIILEKGPKVYPGKSHPQIPLLRARLGVDEAEGDEDVYDRTLVRAVNSFMKTQGWRKKTVFDNKVRERLNNPRGKKTAKRKGRITEKDLLVNMEKWRWMPRDLGDLHVWNNLPSFTTEIVKNGEIVHSERIIIGKTTTQTPVFSGKMTNVVFKPEWGIPSSIKIKTLLPKLAAGDHDVLRRRGMRISINGKTVSPSRYDWAKTDITRIPIIQGPGSSNPLGRMKFMFPNKHAVYMHDTPDKHLFQNKVRTSSSGCIRVRDPQRFAEVVMSEAKSLTASDVESFLDRGAQDNNRVDLDRSIMVHNAYFTIVADENGKLVQLDDIYGHDKRIARALDGVSADVIARSDPARAHEAKMKQLALAAPSHARRAEELLYEQQNNIFASGPTWSFGFQPQPFKPYQPKKTKKYKKQKYESSNSFVQPFWNQN